MNKSVEKFIDGLKEYDKIYNDIEEIIKAHEIKYFNDESSYEIKLYNFSNIAISFTTHVIPFEVIKKINDYIGVDCSRISVSAGHDISLHYSLKEDN